MQNRQAYVYFGPSNITYTSLTIYFSTIKNKSPVFKKKIISKTYKPNVCRGKPNFKVKYTTELFSFGNFIIKPKVVELLIHK